MKATNIMQLYMLIYYSYSALHVLGDVFAHHQEHLTVFTAYGSIHPSHCRLVQFITTILIQNTYVFKLTLLRCFLLNRQNSLNISNKFLKNVLLYFPSHHSCIPIAHFIMLLSDTPKSERIFIP
jgi:hypothetical protein